MIKTNRRNNDITWERAFQITRKLCLYVEAAVKHDIKEFRVRANEIIPKIETIPEVETLERTQSEWENGIRRSHSTCAE